jgi:hypothetical protein
VAAVSVVLILLAGLLVSGATGGGGPLTSAVGITYYAARGIGAQAGSPYGTWTLVDAAGIDLANATQVPLNFSAFGSCNISSFAGAIPPSLTIPKFTGSLTTGALSEWIFTYRSASPAAELDVGVTAGVANLIVEISGPNCQGLGAHFTALPTSIVDSPAAVSAVDTAGGAAFLAAHPREVSLFASVIPAGFGGPGSSVEWGVFYTTCSTYFSSPPPSEPPGATFYADVNGTSGLVVPGSVYTGTCGGPPIVPIGSALALGPPTVTVGAGTGGTVASQGCTTGDYCYSVPIVAASGNVTPGDFTLQVKGAGGSGYPAVGYAILSVAAQVVVYSTGAIEVAWSAGVGSASTPLSATMVMIVDMGTTDPTGQGYYLTLTGTGPFTRSSEIVGLS